MKMFKKLGCMAFLGAVLCLLPQVSHALLGSASRTVVIDQLNFKPYPIAISPLKAMSNDLARDADLITEIVENDLRMCGLFRPLDNRAFIQTTDALLRSGPRFVDWQLIDAQALLYGQVYKGSGDKIGVAFRLFDVVLKREVPGFRLQVPRSKIRNMAHIIADKIYEWRMKVPGYFNTKIAYVATSPTAKNIRKQLMMRDYDGENLRPLTTGNFLVASPVFCPTRPEIAYLSFANNRINVNIVNYHTNQTKALGHFPGMSIAPNYSPDGNTIVFSMTKKGFTDIYKMDLKNKKVMRLTQGRGISTSPCYSPDGRYIVFESDRDGRAHLYIMRADGSSVRRLSSGKGRFSTPVWGKDWIAFTKSNQGFAIGIIRPDGTDERQITPKGFLVEGVRWAPDGQTLIFCRESRKDRKGNFTAGIYTIHMSKMGGEHRLKIPTNALDPAWSKPMMR